MANFIPIASTPDAAGGFLIQPEYSRPLIDAIARRTAIDKVGVKVEQTRTRKKIYPRLVGRPIAAFVDANADAPVTGAEFGKISIVVKKISTIIIYEEEELADAYADPEILLSEEVEAAFSLIIDGHALGLVGGAAITSAFKDEDGVVMDIHSKIPVGGQIEYDQTKQDAFALANSAGASWVEGNGGTVTGIAAANDLRQSLRDARDGTGRPLYQAGNTAMGVIDRSQDQIDGLAWTTNLDAFPAGAGKVASIGGDWSHARMVIRQDVTVKKTTEATVMDGGGANHRTFQQDKIAVKWTARCGFGVHQGDTLFYEVRNAA